MLNDYERIQDLLMFLNREWKVCFNVTLGFKDKMGNRKFFYSEYQYKSKYTSNNDPGKVVSVKRNFKSFITIEQIGNFQNNLCIQRSDMPILRTVVTEAVSWLTNSKVFGLNKEKKMQILTEVTRCCNIGSSSALKFEPVLIPDLYNNMQPGIRMYINDERNFCDIEASNFYSFYELLRTFDFYLSGCAVIAALPITHEDASINRSDIEQEFAQQAEERSFKKKKGFFDK